MDEFDCMLQQRYTCSHNAYTPPTIIDFTGRLSITGEHACFRGGDPPKQASFTTPLASVTSASLSETLLVVELKEGRSLAFKFEAGDAATNALALIEHLGDV